MFEIPFKGIEIFFIWQIFILNLLSCFVFIYQKKLTNNILYYGY